MVLSQVFAYVLLFVIKCRFPTNKSVADIIRERYNAETLIKIRRLEKLDFKVRESELDVEFLQICIKKPSRAKIPEFQIDEHDAKKFKDLPRVSN